MKKSGKYNPGLVSIWDTSYKVVIVLASLEIAIITVIKTLKTLLYI